MAKKIDSEVLENPKRIIGDYISGMTDRFAINLHKQLVKKSFDNFLGKFLLWTFLIF